MILFTVAGSFWLELFLKVGVLKQVKRMLKAIAPVAFLFIAWDKYAISHGHWLFDKDQILGIYGPWCIPLEEYLFFIVVPIAALMTIEAVRKTKKFWPL
ncbi:MAG: lycopene cyclase domain-containing protein [Streptomycetaceae bacterium]|jgi:lycopene cyclase domain-containing protein|nr:MAG: lycopene cyclase domain-containing protein [Streptomycetaceae bacterium]